MYIPPHFAQTDRAVLLEFMRRYSFATLVSNLNGRPEATHIPFIIEENGAEIRLLAHVARANPQGRALAGQEALVIFQEPHAYISPQYYEKTENVPTWNYVAVHAYGPVQLLEEPEAARAVLEKTIAFYEAGYKTQWDALSEDYKRRMIRGITAFEITVTDLQGKEKLSQNRSVNERVQIASGLQSSEDQAVREIAGRMAEQLERIK